MSELGAAGVMAGGSILGGIVGGAFSAHGAKKAAEYNAEMQRKQIEWERERATHAHQWEVSDLKAAGINPALTAQTQGAQTSGIGLPAEPYSGAYTAQGQMLAEGIQSAMTSAAEGAKTVAEIGNIKDEIHTRKSERELKKAQIGNIKDEIDTRKTIRGLNKAQADLADATARNAIVSAKKMKAETAQLEYDNEVRQTLPAEYRGYFDITMDILEKGGNLIGAFRSGRIPKKAQKPVEKAVKKATKGRPNKGKPRGNTAKQQARPKPTWHLEVVPRQ